jgi:hypothetical protein
MIRRFKKGTKIIEAVQFSIEPKNFEFIAWWMETVKPQHVKYQISYAKKSGWIGVWSSNGTSLAEVGDWIVKDVDGEFYPYKADLFEKTYTTWDFIDELPGWTGSWYDRI